MKGTLYLLPNLLNKEADHRHFFPSSVDEAVLSLDGLIAESEKEGRAYLKRFNAPFREMPIVPFNEHTQEVDLLLKPLREGQKWGLIPDAGLPILADPGANLVRRAYDFGIRVEVFVGPSSLILGLMLSGLPAQRFAFHGYLPKNPSERLKTLENRSKQEKSTQAFIETPYRNQQLLETLLNTLSDPTHLCIASDLTSPEQLVETHPIQQWKKRSLPNLHKRPTIFFIYAA